MCELVEHVRLCDRSECVVEVLVVGLASDKDTTVICFLSLQLDAVADSLHRLRAERQTLNLCGGVTFLVNAVIPNYVLAVGQQACLIFCGIALEAERLYNILNIHLIAFCHLLEPFLVFTGESLVVIIAFLFKDFLLKIRHIIICGLVGCRHCLVNITLVNVESKRHGIGSCCLR